MSRPLTEFLLEAASDPALHAALIEDPEGTIEARFGSDSAAGQALLSGNAEEVAAFVQGEHADALGPITQHVVIVGTINLMICVLTPPSTD